MLQEIEPYVFDNQYRSQAPTATSSALCYQERKVLTKKNEDGSFSLPTFKELRAEYAAICDNFTFLFSIDEEGFFLLEGVESLEDYTWMPLPALLGAQPQHLMFAILTGYHLYEWYRSRRYCGWCGTELNKDKHERSLSCPNCKQVEFPRISPAVLVGVINGNKFLLVRQPSYDRYAIVAGFTEIGETLEETVKREVMEEVGLKVRNIRYYKSQPWALAGNLMVGFFCEVDGSDELVIDTTELSDAVWFNREDIPLEEDYSKISLTHEMIALFKSGNLSQPECSIP